MRSAIAVPKMEDITCDCKEKNGRKGCGDDWKRKQEKGVLTIGLPMIGQRLAGGFS